MPKTSAVTFNSMLTSLRNITRSSRTKQMQCRGEEAGNALFYIFLHKQIELESLSLELCGGNFPLKLLRA